MTRIFKYLSVHVLDGVKFMMQPPRDGSTFVNATSISVIRPDGKAIEVLSNGRITPSASLWKPLGDGVTSCYFCGRKLTDEVSYARGVGPECIKNHGCMPGREWLEQHIKEYRALCRKHERAGTTVPKMTDWLAQIGIAIPK